MKTGDEEGPSSGEVETQDTGRKKLQSLLWQHSKFFPVILQMHAKPRTLLIASHYNSSQLIAVEDNLLQLKNSDDNSTNLFKANRSYLTVEWSLRTQVNNVCFEAKHQASLYLGVKPNHTHWGYPCFH